MYYINCFFIYSIFGHLLETFIYLINSGESGILYGFWTPIYGIGCVIILSIYQTLFKHHVSKIIEGITVFLIGAVFLTCIEWIGGTLIEITTGIIFWDYSSLPLHIGHYISWEMALVWGIGSIFLVFLIHPFMNHLIHKIPKYFSVIMIILFLIDILLNIYFRFI